jgi:hypothetical protein
MCGPKMDEVIGGCRKLHDEELCNLYCSSDIRIIVSRRMRWVGYVARMGEYKFKDIGRKSSRKEI